jgi:hypothetical protein
MKFQVEEHELDGSTQLVEVNAPDADKHGYTELDVLAQMQKFEKRTPHKTVMYSLEKEE